MRAAGLALGCLEAMLPLERLYDAARVVSVEAALRPSRSRASGCLLRPVRLVR